MAKQNKELAEKVFKTLNEASISYASVDKKELPMVKALVEAFNSKYKTNFYLDERRSEIVYASLVKEASYDQYSKLLALFQKKGYPVLLTESSVTKFTRLMEAELEQAEIVLAAQNISDRLQKMAEDLAQMVSEDVLPIGDQMKAVFGTDYAEKWSSVTKASLEEAFKVVSRTKDSISDATRVLENKLEGRPTPANDMADKPEGDLGSLGDDGDEGDFLGGSDAAAGPADPIGRAKKESRVSSGNVLTEKAKKEEHEHEEPATKGTIKKLKGGKFSAKNMSGSVKTFSDENKAKKYAETEDPKSGKKKVTESSERLSRRNQDFKSLGSYKGYALGVEEIPDSDGFEKQSYSIYKREGEEPSGVEERPWKLYRNMGRVDVDPYERNMSKIVSTFKQQVDNLPPITEDSFPSFGVKTGSPRSDVDPASMGYGLDNYDAYSNVISRGRADTHLGISKKVHDDAPYTYDIEGDSIVIKKEAYGSFKPSDTKTLSPEESRDFYKEISAADESEHQRIMGEYFNLAHGMYEAFGKRIEQPIPTFGKKPVSAPQMKELEYGHGMGTIYIYDRNNPSDKISLEYSDAMELLNDLQLNPQDKFSILRKYYDSYNKPYYKESEVDEAEIEEGGMPASVIKSKTRYAEMTDEELAKTLANKSEEELRQMAWRHGYGKMSDHYVKRVAKGAKTEASPFTYAAKKAKEQGKTEFELDGETFKVESFIPEDDATAEKAVNALKVGNKMMANKQKRVDPNQKKAVDNLSNAMKKDPKLKDAMDKLIGEGKWDYPDDLKTNHSNPDSLRKKRKTWRKKQKAIAHKALMTGKPNPFAKAPVDAEMVETVITIKEDISLGLTEEKAIKNAAIIHNLSEEQVKNIWAAHR